MEKIKLALERARNERVMTKGEDRSRKVVHKVPKKDVLSKITYSVTKTVAISKDSLRKKRVFVGNNNDSITDQYKVLRTHVLQRLKANQWNLLAVTSPSEGCGKTLTSINLAISLAREVNHSVLLVDLDLRRPTIQSYFYSDEQPGISDYLNERKELSEIMFNPGIERLVVLPGNESITNSSEMLSSPRVVKMVKELKYRYSNRIVIFDMPPLLSCDDMLAFSPLIDAVMIVVEEGRTRKDDLTRAIDLLKNSNVVGTVLNKSKATELSYGGHY